MKKAVVFAVILTMSVTMMTVDGWAAGGSSFGTAKETGKLLSSDKRDHNFVEMTTDGKTLNMEMESTISSGNGYPERYSINVKRAGRSGSQWLQYVNAPGKGSPSYTVKNDGGVKYRHFDVRVNTGKITSDGDYVILIMRRYGSGNDDNAVLYKNGVFRIKGGKISVLNYDNVMANNRSTRAKKSSDPDRYRDPYMKDLQKNLFRSPGSNASMTVTDSVAAYFKTKSDRIVGNARTDYEKAMKIYEFTAENLYYDNYAFSGGKSQYYNPYDLLKKMDTKENTNFSSNGKVGTVCVGYAGVVATLARAQGIPARVARGHHMSLGSTFHTWATEPNIDAVDHWWAELYLDGKWVTVDANAGSGNRWDANRKGESAWTWKGITSYTFFAPTEEELATNYAVYEILGGSSTPAPEPKPEPKPDPDPDPAPAPAIDRPVLKITNTTKYGKPYIKWAPIDGALKYRVYGGTSTSSLKYLGETTGTSMIHRYAVSGKKYYYRVRAVGDGCSALSYRYVRSCDLAQPSIKVYSLSRSSKNKVVWNRVTGAKSYSLYISTSKYGTYRHLITTRGTAVIHSSAKPGVRYYYKLRANAPSSSANSAYSVIYTCR